MGDFFAQLALSDSRSRVQPLEVLHLQELTSLIELAHGQRAVPRPDGHVGNVGNVGNGVLIASQVVVLRQPLVHYIELALYFNGVAVDLVFGLARRVGLEMAEAATQRWRVAHLPKYPRRTRMMEDELITRCRTDVTGAFRLYLLALVGDDKIWGGTVQYFIIVF